MMIEIPTQVALTEAISLAEASRIVSSLNTNEDLGRIYSFGLQKVDETDKFQVVAIIIRARDLMVRSPTLKYHDV